MREILFLCHRVPFPPDRGDKIRSHHVLRRLTRIAPVHVACFADDDGDMAEEVELAALATSYRLIRRSKRLACAGLQAILRRRPVSLTVFHDPVLADYVAHLLATRPIGTIFVFSGQMGQYVPEDFQGRVIVDLCDVDSAKFEAYAEQSRGFMGWVHAREADLLRREEARLAAQADVTLLISSEEAELFASRLSTSERREADVRVLGNGIDSAFYDPALVAPAPQLQGFAAPRLIFTGQMDYTPNVDAVVRMARRIMPLVHQSLPEASFHVVGRSPTEDVRDLHGVNGTHVWGRVEDVRVWLKAADIAVAPLDIARGVQNKVLEAMAMELPVVLTPAAATGISAVDGHHFAVARTDEALAAAIVELAGAPGEANVLGMAARRFVVEQQSWQSALAGLPAIIGPHRAISNAA